MPSPLSPRQLRFMTKAVRGLAKVRRGSSIVGAVGLGGALVANAPKGKAFSTGQPEPEMPPGRTRARNFFVALGAGGGAAAAGAHYLRRGVINYARRRL